MGQGYTLKCSKCDYEKTYRCGKCKKDIMKVIDDDKVHMLNCPKCHEMLEIAGVMMWD